MHPDSWRYRGCLCVSILLCKSDWFACLAFGAASPFAGFACGLGFVTLRAEDLKVLVVVVVGAPVVVDVVYFQALGTTALGTLVSVTRQDSFTCNGGDVRGVAISPHCSPSLMFVPCSSRELVACASGVVQGFQCVMVSCMVRWLQGLVKTTNTPNVC